MVLPCLAASGLALRGGSVLLSSVWLTGRPFSLVCAQTVVTALQPGAALSPGPGLRDPAPPAARRGRSARLPPSDLGRAALPAVLSPRPQAEPWPPPDVLLVEAGTRPIGPRPLRSVTHVVFRVAPGDLLCVPMAVSGAGPGLWVRGLPARSSRRACGPRFGPLPPPGAPCWPASATLCPVSRWCPDVLRVCLVSVNVVFSSLKWPEGALAGAAQCAVSLI